MSIVVLIDLKSLQSRLSQTYKLSDSNDWVIDFRWIYVKIMSIWNNILKILLEYLILSSY